MFDIQAHRGGAGLRPENTLPAFAHALSLGVSTLELDMHVSLDGQAVVSHDRVLNADTVEGPWTGQFISRLTAAQCAEMTCGGNPIPTLDEVIALLDAHDADDVGLNVETKFDVLHPDEEAPRQQFVDVVLDTLSRHDMLERSSVQCFDWWILDQVREREPRVALNVLANMEYLQRGEPGASPWLGGLDIDDFAGSLAQAAGDRGYDAISPSQTILTPAMVAEAHERDLRVVPYTVDNLDQVRRLLALDVDGVITNRPDLVRELLGSLGEPVPPPHPRAG